MCMSSCIYIYIYMRNNNGNNPIFKKWAKNLATL